MWVATRNRQPTDYSINVWCGEVPLSFTRARVLAQSRLCILFLAEFINSWPSCCAGGHEHTHQSRLPARTYSKSTHEFFCCDGCARLLKTLTARTLHSCGASQGNIRGRACVSLERTPSSCVPQGSTHLVLRNFLGVALRSRYPCARGEDFMYF